MKQLELENIIQAKAQLEMERKKLDEEKRLIEEKKKQEDDAKKVSILTLS